MSTTDNTTDVSSDVSNEVTQRKVINRLKRARGQLDAVITAVESRESCKDIVTQLAAVTHALNRAGFVVVSNSLAECLADTETGQTEDGLTREELEKLFLMLA